LIRRYRIAEGREMAFRGDSGKNYWSWEHMWINSTFTTAIK
jgi:hypothetical protein